MLFSLKDAEIEDLIYTQMADHNLALKLWPLLYGVDIKLVAAIIFIERQQYNLKDLRHALTRTTGSIMDFIDNHRAQPTGDNWQDVGSWVNNSRGFTRIKYDTALRAMLLQQPTAQPMTKEDLIAYRTKPQVAIKMACGILKVHQEQWQPVAGPISPAIMATLYNISDFVNRVPHKNPQVGGSVLPAIIDGVFYKSKSFGERVQLVYDSKKLNIFIKNIWL